MIKEKLQKNIGTKLMLIIAIVSSILFLSIILISNYLVSNGIHTIIDNTVTESTQDNADYISDWFEDKKNQLEDYAATPVVRSMDWEEAEAFLEERHKQYSDIYEVLFIADTTGEYNATAGEDGNVSERDYFPQVMAGKTAISEPLIAISTGNPISVIATPIKENNEVIGLMGATVNLNILNDFISDINIAHNDSYSYLVNGEGLFITHPDSELVLQESLTEANGLENVADIILNQQSGQVEYTYEGMKTYAYFQEIPELNNWRLLTRVPHQFIEEPINNVRNILIILLIIALLVLLAVSFKIGNYIAKPLNIISNYSQRIANKDFSAQLDTKWTERKDEFGTLAKSFNIMNNNLQGILKELSASVQNLSAYSHELSASAEEGNATIDNTNYLVENMSASIQQISSSAQEVASFSESATSQADLGANDIKATVNSITNINTSVQETVTIINDLDTNAKKIEEIIELITNIAEQTNLLALNAAIEAARASEHGQGFAVVADEIRQLAEETSQATEKIYNLINKVQQQSAKGLTAVNEVEQKTKEGKEIAEKTGAKFTEIQEIITETSSQIEQTANATNELAQNSNEITNATKEIKNMSDEVTNSSQELSKMAQKLQTLIKEFKI
ncbi:methyl-accepting chemotaxis protein [Natroniella sp. ANB-PHB2]|uniref:methyl-accepting chemotaxis protein n=1 Tax=Natroniella sp. ANB-PHB2 TaxID=3384444 RepID=UPI0038D398A9